jgi:hypothetical protein
MCAAPHLAPADRRASPRCDVLERQLVLVDLVVDLRCDNGGIVLNCGQGGIAIQAVAPPPQGPGHELLVYLPDAPKPVVAIGDIVWVNEFNQAGIRFTAMPGMSRARFAEWLEQNARTHPACAKIMATLPGTPGHEPSMTQGPVPAQATPLASPLHPNPSAEHSIPPQGANQVPAMDDTEPWGPAFAAAAVLSLVLMLLCSQLLRRTTSLPSFPAPNRQPPASVQQTQRSVPITPTSPPAAVQTSTTTSPPQPPSVSPPEPHPAARPSTTRPHSRQVRRDEQDDDDDEVIVRHFNFMRPAPPAAAREQQTPPPR